MKNRLVTIDSTKRTLTISTSGLEDKGYQLINGSDIILVNSLGNSVYELKLRNGLIALPIDLTTLSNTEYNSGDAQSSLQFLSDVGGIMNKPPPEEAIQITSSSFGEQLVVQPTTFIQTAPVYNLIPSNFIEYTSASGTTGVDNRMFKVTTGTTVFGYGKIQSLRALSYNAGQGGRARFTMRFDSAVADSWQAVGLMSISDELSFGYNGIDFGIWYRKDGFAEVRTIAITGASSGSTDLTLTLNSVVYTIPLTSGTVEHNAYEVADWLENNQSVWKAEQLDDTVIISALTDGAKSGTYSFSHATATGTITQNKAGVTKTSTHIVQSEWNVNNLSDWNTPFDPTKGNVAQITYKYLGFGDIFFWLENPDTGRFQNVHIIKYTNQNTTPSLLNPSFKLGLYAESVGSTTDLSVYSASMAAFVDGTLTKTKNPRAVENTQSVGTGGFTNILTIRNRNTYNSFVNQGEIIPIILSLSTDSSKSIEIRVVVNGTPSGDTDFTEVGTNLVSDIDVTANTITGGTLLIASALRIEKLINLDDLEIRIFPSFTFSITARLTSGSSADVTAALTYYESI